MTRPVRRDSDDGGADDTDDAASSMTNTYIHTKNNIYINLFQYQLCELLLLS